MEHPRVLVTGAAGFLGSHGRVELHRSGSSFVGIDDFSNGPQDAVGHCSDSLALRRSSKLTSWTPIDSSAS